MKRLPRLRSWTSLAVALCVGGCLLTSAPSAHADAIAPLKFELSLTKTGNTITLLNDSATPGNSKYYGTNSSGTKGFFDLPTGGGGIGGSIADQQVAVGNGPDNITGSSNFTWDSSIGKLSVLGQATGVNDVDTTTGIESVVISLLPTGKTVDSSYGISLSLFNQGEGVITNAWGSASYITAPVGSISTAYGYSSEIEKITTTPGESVAYLYYGFGVPSPSIAEMYGLWIDDLTGAATNGYFLWYNSPGVYRVKYDGVMAYYNPAFTPKYTPGATDYERVVQQWNSNVLEYGTESSGTGTPRPVRIIGPQVKIANLTTNGYVQAINGDGTLVVYTPTPTATPTATATSTPTPTPTPSATATPTATPAAHSVTFIVPATAGTSKVGTIPYGFTVNKWKVLCDVSCSVTVDVLRAANGAGLPSASIVGAGTKPSISSAVESGPTTPVSWTSTTLSDWDNVAVTLSGISGSPTQVTLVLDQ